MRSQGGRASFLGEGEATALAASAPPILQDSGTQAPTNHIRTLSLFLPLTLPLVLSLSISLDLSPFHFPLSSFLTIPPLTTLAPASYPAPGVPAAIPGHPTLLG